MKQFLRKPSGMVLGAIVLAVVIAGIAASLYRITNNQGGQTAQAAKPADTPLQMLVTRLGTALRARYTYLHSTSPKPQTAVGYQMSGYTFQVVLSVATASIAYTDASTANEQASFQNLSKSVSLINERLLEGGFKELPASSQQGTLTTTYFYSRTDAVCQVSIYTQLEITCVPSSQLKDAADAAKPLVSAYLSVVPNDGESVVAAPTIRPSQTSGFTIATLPIYNDSGETAANFYRLTGADWQLVSLGWYNDPYENGTVMPNCEDFESNVEIRQAFVDQSCYDSESQTMRTILD
jgi:hypothetical protein